MPYWDAAAARADYDYAVANNLDCWVPAGVGSEVPGISRGRWYLYVWNPKERDHAYLDIATDTVYSTLDMNEVR